MTGQQDQHGYVSLGLFIFGLSLAGITAGAALVAWIISGAPILLGIAVVIIAVAVWATVRTLFSRGR